jgi:hypothetical protein
MDSDPQFFIIWFNSNGIISETIYAVEGRSCYFIERDPKHFPIILSYFRNKAIIHSDITTPW